MIEIDPGKFVDINMIESVELEGSVYFITMTSGMKHMVSPSVYARVITVKKSLDSTKTELRV